MPFKENSIIKSAANLVNITMLRTYGRYGSISMKDDVDINDFVASSEYTGEYMFDTLRGIVENSRTKIQKDYTCNYGRIS